MSLALDNLLHTQEQICYIQCGFCTTILLVSVPCRSLSMVMTVRCGHCTSILPVDMSKACFVPTNFLSSLNHQDQRVKSLNSTSSPKQEECFVEDEAADKNVAMKRSASLCFSSDDEDSVPYNQIIHKPPEKKQRTPSAYNYFIKEEIKRLKIEYPNMTHKQAFSAAAKNWAHNPQNRYQGGEVQLYGEGHREMMTMHSDIN